MAFDPAYADAIASIESGGKYGLLGPTTKSGDRAYGKYQVMGSNVPVWTKEVLGMEMTPQQFLSNPQAQDAVFQGKFGQYVEKFGPEGAAQAWFAGPGGVGKLDRKDQLGTSVGSYGQRFMSALGPQTPTVGGAPQPFEPQKPLPPQPLNLGAAPQPVYPVAQQEAAPVAPQNFDQQQIPMLNAPPQVRRAFNLAQAFSRIPLPPGFRGFSLG